MAALKNKAGARYAFAGLAQTGRGYFSGYTATLLWSAFLS